MEFRVIPDTQGFAISDNGILIDSTEDVKNTYINGDGYITAAVLKTDGTWVTMGIHRLMALAWLLDDPCYGLSVNHIDCVLTNNVLDNIEWCTVAENTLHASLMSTTHDRPRLLLYRDSVVEFCYNLPTAVILLNKPLREVWDMVRTGRVVDGVRLVPFTKRTKIPDALKKATIPKGVNITDVGVKVMDIETNEIMHFDSLGSAASFFNTTASHIHTSIPRGNRRPVFKSHYVVAYTHDDFVIPTTEDLYRAAISSGKDTYAYNPERGELLVFPSVGRFIDHTKLSRKAVTTRLRNKGHGEYGGWFFSYESHAHVIRELIQSSSSE